MSNVEKTAWKIQASCPQGRVLTIDQALVVANVLEEAGLLAPAPRVIRTMEELRQFDEYTVFMNDWGDLFDVNNVQAGMKKEDLSYYFPCSVVASGEQVRAAREALEEEND